MEDPSHLCRYPAVVSCSLTSFPDLYRLPPLMFTFVKVRSAQPSRSQGRIALQVLWVLCGHLGPAHASSLGVAGWPVPRWVVSFPGLAVSWKRQAGPFSVVGLWGVSLWGALQL